MRRLVAWTVPLVALQLLTACTIIDGGSDRRPPTSPPDAVKSGFAGRLLVDAFAVNETPDAHNTEGLWQLTIAANNRLTATPLVPVNPDDGTVWAVSPDRHWLAYVRRNQLLLRDLSTGQERQLRDLGMPYNGSCVTWSPDGTRLLVRNTNSRKEDGLSVVGLDGSAVDVDRDLVGLYAQDGSADPLGRGLHGVLMCGAWLDANRLIFDRLHALPNRVVAGNNMIIQPDTTTVAVLSGGSVRLVDSATRWKLVDSCGGWIAAERSTGSGAVHLLNHPTEATLTTGDGALADSSAVADTTSEKHERDFAFQPGTCRPLFARDDGIHAIDPVGRSVLPQMLVSSARTPHSFLQVQWRPDRPQVAENYGHDVGLADLATGLTVMLTPEPNLNIGHLVAWLA